MAVSKSSGDQRQSVGTGVGESDVIVISHSGTTTNGAITGLRAGGQVVGIESAAPSLLTDTDFNINFLSADGNEIGNKDGIAHNTSVFTNTTTDNIHIPKDAKIQIETVTSQTDEPFNIKLLVK